MKKYEMLPSGLYKENEIDYRLDSVKWISVTEEFLVESLTRNRIKRMSQMKVSSKIVTEDELNRFEIDYIKDILALGKVVKGYSEYFRIQDDDAKRCPSCGGMIDDIFYSLSIRDDKTHICDDCGEKEVFEYAFATK